MENKILGPTPTEGSAPADPYKCREQWLQFVRPIADCGKLEKLRTVRAKTKREKKTADMQNYYLSRKSFGCFGQRYDLIDWGK